MPMVSYASALPGPTALVGAQGPHPTQAHALVAAGLHVLEPH